MSRVTEPSEGKARYEPPSLLGNVTLCGITDFIGVEAGASTDAPVTCEACIAIFQWCNSHHA